MSERNRRPERTCLGCRGRDAKDSMLRLAVSEGRVVIDEAGRLGGRGGYLHRRQECLGRFVKVKIKEFRSLKRNIALDERIRIAELIQGAAG